MFAFIPYIIIIGIIKKITYIYWKIKKLENFTVIINSFFIGNDINKSKSSNPNKYPFTLVENKIIKINITKENIYGI